MPQILMGVKTRFGRKQASSIFIHHPKPRQYFVGFCWPNHQKYFTKTCQLHCQRGSQFRVQEKLVGEPWRIFTIPPPDINGMVPIWNKVAEWGRPRKTGRHDQNNDFFFGHGQKFGQKSPGEKMAGFPRMFDFGKSWDKIRIRACQIRI